MLRTEWYLRANLTVTAMNKNIFQKAISVVLASAIALSSTAGLAATGLPAPAQCQTLDGYTIGYFNGVLNTRQDAERSAALLRAQQYEKRFAVPTGETLIVQNYFNDSKGWRDFIEVFEQRVLQQDENLSGRWELFQQAISGDLNKPGDSWFDKLGTVFNGFTDWINSYQDYLITQVPSAIAARFGIANLASLIIGDETEAIWQTEVEHRQRLETTINEGRKLVMVAHSQGNLFVHEAYKNALKLTTSNFVKVVHTASASPFTHGPHVVADKDLVIKGLNLFFTNPPVYTVIPGLLERLNPGPTDWKGHSLEMIYLNELIPTKPLIDGHIINALSSIQAPPKVAQPGLFTVTLDWDGPGDVDLHTYEPNGNKVYFSNKIGSSGRLDVDNISGYGPEHFYASCDTNRIMDGDYNIGVANYSRADGRRANIQVATPDGGVIATESVTLGTATGTQTYLMPIRINVKRDQTTGAVKVKKVG